MNTETRVLNIQPMLMQTPDDYRCVPLERLLSQEIERAIAKMQRQGWVLDHVELIETGAMVHLRQAM